MYNNNIKFNIDRAKRKLKYIYYKNYFSKRILYSKPVICDSSLPFEIHMLTNEKAVIESLWCLKTFYHFIDLFPKIVIHDDGSLSDKAISIFQKHFEGVRVIRKIDSDQQMKEYLKNYEYSLKYQIDNYMPHSIKLFDFFYFSNSSLLALDSDILFFNKPIEVYKFLNQRIGFYMSDYRNSYSFSHEYIKEKFNFEISSKINSGLFFIPSVMDYDKLLIENVLRLCYEKNYPLNQWTEQTTYAILFSKYRHKFKRLSKTYQISNQSISKDTVCHHFVNDGSRPLFYTRGIKTLKKSFP